MKWINVKQRLPNDDGWVIAYDPKVKSPFFFSDGVGLAYRKRKGKGFSDTEYIIKPTHWMPLPKPPPENEDE